MKRKWSEVWKDGLPPDGAWVAVVQRGWRKHGCLLDGKWKFSGEVPSLPARADMWILLPDLPERLES